MTTKFVMLSGLCIGRYYNLVRFRHGISMVDIQMEETASTNIKSEQNLGKFLDMLQYGRSYDPAIILHFECEDRKLHYFEPSFGYMEAYVEYDPDTEEMSKLRIQKRTRLLEQEIKGNDWALRPENVILTQGIDLSGWAEGLN